jgi:hypothetical protein
MNLLFHAFALTLIAAGFAMGVLYVIELWRGFYQDWKDAGARAARSSQRNGDGVEPKQSPLRGSPVTDFFGETNEGDAA